MPKVGKTVKQPKDTSGSGYCRKCQKTMSLNKFYEATDLNLDTNGFFSICRECCNDIYNIYFSIYKDMEKSLYLTCQDLNVCFSFDALNATKSHLEKLSSNGKELNAIFGLYKSKLGSTTKTNGGNMSLVFRDSDKYNQDNIDININQSESNFKVTEEIIKYWGRNLNPWEYEYLDEEKLKIQSSFECPDYGMEMLMRDICFINLTIERIRQGVDKGDISKLIETRSKLMNDAKMKPIQASGAEANDQITFGTLIRKWENEKPVSQALDDEMKKYIDTYMIGHLAKMQGLNCDLVDKYEESLKEYTIDFEELNNEDDE